MQGKELHKLFCARILMRSRTICGELAIGGMENGANQAPKAARHTKYEGSHGDVVEALRTREKRQIDEFDTEGGTAYVLATS